MTHDDANHARIRSRCDRARTRSSRSQNYSRSPTDDPRPLPAFRPMFLWTPGGKEGEIAISDISTDQQTSRPKALICVIKSFDLEIGQFEIAPIMQPWSFSSSPCRQAFPVGRAPRLGDARGRAGNRSPLAPGVKYMSAADPEYIAFACFAQLLFDIANTVDSIACDPLEWYGRGYGLQSFSSQALIWSQSRHRGGTYAALRRVGSSVHSCGRYSARSINA
jgi:hypothetical protein